MLRIVAGGGGRAGVCQAARVDAVNLEGAGVTVDDVVAVAREHAPVQLAGAARTLLERDRQALDRLAARGEAVYGLTRALGAKSGVTVPGDDLAAFQVRVVRGRQAAVGPPLRDEIVRATLFARAAALAAGGSGISPHVLDALLELLAVAEIPRVPSIGSVGASDLVVLAHAVAPLLDGVALAPKDGLTLISANSLSIGWGALAIADGERLLAAASAAAALSMEGFGATLDPLDERAQRARPLPGQAEEAARLRGLLRGSPLEAGAARNLQDPLSLRCVVPVHAVARTSLANARAIVQIELNAAADNPLVVAADGVAIGTANFHAGALALAFDSLAIALHGLASLAAARVARLLDERSSGLPRGLSPRGADRAGLVALQKPLAALVARVRALATPASLDVIAISEGVEDHASHAPLAVEQAHEAIALCRLAVAIELVVAAQAVDLRGASGLGAGTARVHAEVRSLVPALDDDRACGPDVDAVAAALADGSLGVA